MSRGFEETPFLIGDSDLYLLGVAAGLAARYHAQRKGITIHNDQDYQAQVLAGVNEAGVMHIEDVPPVRIGVFCSDEIFQRLRTMVRNIEGSP